MDGEIVVMQCYPTCPRGRIEFSDFDQGNGILWPGGSPRLPVVLGHQRHRTYQNKGQVTPDQWPLRAAPQNHFAGVLSGDVPQEKL